MKKEIGLYFSHWLSIHPHSIYEEDLCLFFKDFLVCTIVFIEFVTMLLLGFISFFFLGFFFRFFSGHEASGILVP